MALRESQQLKEFILTQTFVNLSTTFIASSAARLNAFNALVKAVVASDAEIIPSLLSFVDAETNASN